MSLRALVWALDQDLPCAHKFVLVVLGDYLNETTSICNPSQAKIAQKCGLSRQSVSRILADLEERGFLTFEQQKRPNGSSSSCSYRLNCPVFRAPGPAGESPGTLGRVYVATANVGTKIGITKKPIEQRIKALSAGLASDVTLVDTFEAPIAIARRAEKIAQQKLENETVRGEWFHCTPAQAIAAVKEAIDEAQREMVVSNDETPPCKPVRHPPVSGRDTHNPYKEPLKGTNTRTDRQKASDAAKKSQVDECRRYWNAFAKQHDLPHCDRLSKAEEKSLAQAVNGMGGAEKFCRLVDRIAGSPFLLGKNVYRFRADLRWLFAPRNYERLSEGFYDGMGARDDMGGSRRRNSADWTGGGL